MNEKYKSSIEFRPVKENLSCNSCGRANYSVNGGAPQVDKLYDVVIGRMVNRLCPHCLEALMEKSSAELRAPAVHEDGNRNPTWKKLYHHMLDASEKRQMSPQFCHDIAKASAACVIATYDVAQEIPNIEELTERIDKLDGFGLTIGEMTMSVLPLINKFGADILDELSDEELQKEILVQSSKSFEKVIDSFVSFESYQSAMDGDKDKRYTRLIHGECTHCSQPILLRYELTDQEKGRKHGSYEFVGHHCTCSQGLDDVAITDGPEIDEWAESIFAKLEENHV